VIATDFAKQTANDDVEPRLSTGAPGKIRTSDRQIRGLVLGFNFCCEGVATTRHSKRSVRIAN
jgi:hypothetical protein